MFEMNKDCDLMTHNNKSKVLCYHLLKMRRTSEIPGALIKSRSEQPYIATKS